jgi:hypothetical protein
MLTIASIISLAFFVCFIIYGGVFLKTLALSIFVIFYFIICRPMGGAQKAGVNETSAVALLSGRIFIVSALLCLMVSATVAMPAWITIIIVIDEFMITGIMREGIADRRAGRIVEYVTGVGVAAILASSILMETRVAVAVVDGLPDLKAVAIAIAVIILVTNTIYGVNAVYKDIKRRHDNE